MARKTPAKAKRSTPTTRLPDLVDRTNRRADKLARALLAGLTQPQLDEIGTMLGMSNCGCDRFDLPEAVAESDKMYEDLMGEIRVWRKELRDPKKGWGWCDDLPEMVAAARKRRPSIWIAVGTDQKQVGLPFDADDRFQAFDKAVGAFGHTAVHHVKPVS